MSAPSLNDWPSWVTPGWYIALPSQDLKKGEVKPIEIAGRELVVFRTESGKAVILDRYCVHLGASLAIGKVMGETVRCSFHHWKYDTNGVCVEIPDCPKIPPRARMRNYPVVERLSVIWIFVGEQVYYQLPEEEEVLTEGPWFSPGAYLLGTYKTSCRDILENPVDYPHAKTLHQYNVLEISHTLHPEKNLMKVNFVSEYPVFSGLKIYSKRSVRRLEATTSVYAPSMSHNRFNFGKIARRHVFMMLQPVGPQETRAFLAPYVQGRGVTPLNWALSKMFALMDKQATRDDGWIWNNKIVLDQPILSGADRGPVMAYRKWWATLGKGTAAAAAESDPAGEPARKSGT